MPTPNAGESHDDFMARCVPMVMEEGKENDAAVAQCSSMFEEHQNKMTRKSGTVTAKLLADTGSVTIKAGAVDGEKKGPPTFDGTAYSGGVVSRNTLNIKLDADYVIDLGGMTHRKGIKANLDHKANQRTGHVTSVVNDGKELKVAGVLSAATPYRTEVAESAADGFDWEVSIEADLSQPKRLDVGKSAVVNGRTVSGPLYIYQKGVLTGLGFVSNGADAGNNVTIAASAAGVTQMNEFDKFVVSCGADPETITDAHRATLQKAFDAMNASPVDTGGKPKSFAETAAEQRQENARRDTIAKMGREAMRECPLYIDQIERAVLDAIESKMSGEKFELQLLREMRTQTGSLSLRQPNTASDPKVIAAAMCIATGLPNIEKHYSPQVLDAVDRAGLRGGFSLQQALLQAAASNGYVCRAGERITVSNIRAVLEYCFPPVMARMGFSTTALPNILGEVANKQILAGYMEEDMTWQEIAEVRPVSNFYTQNHYRMLDSLEYEEVGSGGEIPHGTLGEETYTSQAKTYGKMLGITRTQIVNDDLGAFVDLRTRLGRGAAKKFGNVFWTAFLDNASFFTAALTNYISGSTTNLGTDGVGLGLAVAAFRQMTTPAADGLKRVGAGLNPSKIIVPPELEANAEMVFQNTNLGQVVMGTGANIYARRYRPVVQWRLSNASFTGNSTTAWYLFGDNVKPMLVTFLNGNQTPIVESTDADFNTLGVQFRGYHDFGCDKSEYLAGIKSKGAA